MLSKFKALINSQIDITESLLEITIDTQLFDSAGSCEVKVLKLPMDLPDGCMFDLYQNEEHIFYGRLVKQTITDKNTMTLVFYDDIFYLNSKDANTFTNMTADKIFLKHCKDYNIPARVDTTPTYILPPKIQQNTSCYEIIKESINLSFINDGVDYVIIPMERELVFTDTSKLKKDIVIGTEAYCTGYTYERSIDSDTYNVIKIVKEVTIEEGEGTESQSSKSTNSSGKTKRLEQFVVKDAHNMDMWGVLQYYDTIDEKANKAQIQQKAENLLKLKNRVWKTLKISTLCPIYLRAGYGVILDIGVVPLQHYLIKSCTYKIKDSSIIADLEVELR